MVLLPSCCYRSFPWILPLTWVPLSASPPLVPSKTGEILDVFCASTETRITFGTHKEEVLGSSPDEYLQRLISYLDGDCSDKAQGVSRERGGLETEKTPIILGEEHGNNENTHGQIPPKEGCTTSISQVELALDELLGKPTHFSTLTSLLRHCGKIKALSNGKQVHAHIRKYGHDRDTYLGNCVVQMYGNCGSMEDAQTAFDAITNPNLYSWTILITAYVQNGNLYDARSVFDLMPQRDVVCWNAMIAAHARTGHGKDALELFHRMQVEGFKPNNITFVCVLGACKGLTNPEKREEIHIAIIDSGYEQNVVVGTALVNIYGKCGSLHDARRVFRRMPERNAISWNAMISACAENEHHKEATDLLQQMKLEGFEPDRTTFVNLLHACSSLVALEEGRAIHAAIVDSGYEQDDIVGTAIVNMYGKCRKVHNAKDAFSRIRRKNVFSWSAIITVCAENGHSEEALDLFCQMQLEGLMPDRVTFVSLLDACTGLTALQKGWEVHNAIVNSGYEQDFSVGNALLNMYGKCGNVHEARSVFDQMSERNVVSWSAMVAAYGQNGHSQDALDLFHQMQHDGIEPTYITFICALDACISMAALQEGLDIHGAIVDSGFEKGVAVGNALVTMYGKCGSLQNARSVFAKIFQKDVISWSAMINTCSQNGHMDEALNLFHLMQLDGCEPNNITFVCVLDVCASHAALKEGKEIHAAIINSGHQQDVLVGNAIVSMYGKCGSLYDAKLVFERMPEKDLVSWNAIIAACSQNGHGKEALDFYHRMQLDGVGPDNITFVSVLTACSHTGQVDDGRHCFVSINKQYGIVHTQEHYASMIDLLGRAGHLDEAEDLLHTMPFENSHLAWSSLVANCRIHNDVERGEHAANHCLKLAPKNAASYIFLSNSYAGRA